MRIISGKFKGRKFIPSAKNWPTRPTTDFAKEGLFNILQNNFDFEELKVLDLFGGTGSHSYEFISRGCTDVTYVDNFGAAVAFVKKTAEILDIKDVLKVFKSDVFKFIKNHPLQYDYIFAGPPYPLSEMEAIPNWIFEHELLKPEGWFVLEHSGIHDFKDHPNYQNERKYGKAIFSIFSTI